VIEQGDQPAHPGRGMTDAARHPIWIAPHGLDQERK
jgi:hypothetical protein